MNFTKPAVTQELLIAKKSASNPLGLRPFVAGPEKAAQTYDVAVEHAVTSGRKGTWLALTKDGEVVVASRPTIKRHGWTRLGRITVTAAPRHDAE